MKTLSKEQEIQLLTKLANGKGYFAEKFKNDFDIMVKNISNDFPIELGTSFAIAENQLRIAKGFVEEKLNTIESLVETINGLRSENKSFQEKINSIAVNLVVKESEASICSPYDHFTIEEIIPIKLENGILLNKSEVEYVTERLSETSKLKM